MHKPPAARSAGLVRLLPTRHVHMTPEGTSCARLPLLIAIHVPGSGR